MKRWTLFCLLAFFQFSGIAWGLELPSSFDLRDIDGRSYIGAVRDQGACGSCWSFGTLASAESVWNRTYDKYDEQAVDFSESFLVWSLSPLYENLKGCDGGGLDLPQNDALIEYGVPLEEAFPYTINDPGGDPDEDLHWDAQRSTFLDWYRIPPGDIETMRRVLYEVGAITTAVLVEDDFYAYQEGIFENQRTTIGHSLPYYSSANHLISLVGWVDEPGDDGLGYWILRNSWDPERWGEDGYMRIRYTSARAALFGSYVTLQEWTGQSIDLANDREISADPWSVGGTLNAHGVELWGGAASSVANQGLILARAESVNELVTARGVYLWGGPERKVSNEGEIGGLAASETQQAYAYGICLQGGSINNAGQVGASAVSELDQAMAFGLWVANGGHDIKIINDGTIRSIAMGDGLNAAYGIWTDSRAMSSVYNHGSIGAFAEDYAVGVLLSGGPAILVNSGLIEATASFSEPDLDSGLSVGVRATSKGTIIRNSGAIKGTTYSIYSSEDTFVTLETGSDLVGPARFIGDNDFLGLFGTGTEEVNFYGVEKLVMAGINWSLSGDSGFGSIEVRQGRLGIDGALVGGTSVLSNGILGGNGSLAGIVTSAGTVAPGASVGHLTINGDFIQSGDGTLEIEIGDGIADRLTVTGTADLAGQLLLLPDGYATDGSYTFLEAGAITGGFETLSAAAVLSFDLTSAADNLILDVTRNSYASLSTSHNQSLSTVLDTERPTAEGDYATLLDSLDLALNRDVLNDAMETLTPRINGAASVVVMEDAQARLSDLRHRLRQNDAEVDSRGMTGWLKILGQDGNYRRDGAYDEMQVDLYGLMLGVEHKRSDWTLGSALTVAENRYQVRHSGDDGESDSQQGYLYAAWGDPRLSCGWHLNAVAGGGLVQLEADRSIPFASRQAESDHDGTLYGASINGGYQLKHGGWIIDPTAGLSFVHLREQSFHEKGADSANLTIATRDNDSLQSQIGLRLSRPVQLSRVRLVPELQAEWRHEFDRRSEDLSASLAGGGDRFDIPGRDLASDRLLLGLSLGGWMGESLYAGLGYDCELQSSGGSTRHALNLEVAARF